MRGPIVAMVVVTAACGGRAPAPGVGAQPGPGTGQAATKVPPSVLQSVAGLPLPETSRGVALPANAKAYVIAAQKAVRFSIGDTPAIEMTADTDTDVLLADVHARLAPAAPCTRGATATTAVQHIIARVEAPAATDAVVAIDGSRPSTGLVGMIAVLGYPTVIAVRDPKSNEVRALPLRFCAGYAASPPSLPSTVEVATTPMGIFALSSGGYQRSGVAFPPATAPASELADHIGRATQGAELRTVRIFTHENVSINAFVVQLEAALAANTREVIVVLDRREPDLLTVRMTATRVSGGVPQSRARSELLNRMEALRACYVRAAFTNPQLAGKITLKAGVNAVGALSVSVAADTDEMTRCAATALANIRVPNVKSAGLVEIDLELARTNPRDAAAPSDISIHGTGP
jgi:hypothetical protein